MKNNPPQFYTPLTHKKTQKAIDLSNRNKFLRFLPHLTTLITLITLTNCATPTIPYASTPQYPTPPTSTTITATNKKLNISLLSAIRKIGWAPLHVTHDNTGKNITKISTLLPDKRIAIITITSQKTPNNTHIISAHVQHFGSTKLENQFLNQLKKITTAPTPKQRNKYFTLPKNYE